MTDTIHLEKDANPAAHAIAVTKSDYDRFERPTRGIYVGGTGNVIVDMFSGATDVTFTAVPAGTILPIRVIRVKVASTATNMVAMF